ncbi:MAG: sigma-70 family RNA polymerase sigma factor [Vicinamibacterales bacterium]
MTRPRTTTADVPASTKDLEAADDRALVEAFLAGRREAFDVIVRRHQRHVYHLCLRFVRSHEDAADLAQDVFVRAFKGLDRFKGEASLGTWLYRVGVNVCLNRIAVKRPASEPLEPTEHVDVRAEDPFDRVARSERSAAMRAAIDQLPPKQRATVILRVYQDLSHEEIAQVLGSSVGAVKANFFHALGNLKRLMQTS